MTISNFLLRLPSFSSSTVGLTGAIIVVLLLLILWRRSRRGSNALPLPPGPQGTFFSGAKHLLPRTEPWKTYAEWSEVYQSPIISFRIHTRRTIILNSLPSIQALLIQRANAYSDRPMNWMYNEICGRAKAVFNVNASSPSTLHSASKSSSDSKEKTKNRHRTYRRLLQTGLSRTAVERSWGILEREARVLVEEIELDSAKWVQHLRRNATASIMSLAFGYTITSLEDPFVAVAEESAKISGWAMAPGRWMVEYYPWLRFVPSFLPGVGWKRQGLRWREQLRYLSDVPYRWAKEQIANGTAEPSFLSRLLISTTTPEEEDAIRWCAGGLYAGAADTTVSALSSFILLMALHPDVQRRAQAEIEAVMPNSSDHNNSDANVDPGGNDEQSRKIPHSSELDRLPYLLAIMKEVLRYAPVANLALPHALAQDDMYMGFHLPKGASVIPNVWAIMHDPKLYPDPFTFNPDRFIDSEDPVVDADIGREEHDKIPDPRQFAYGFGRRVCPGVHLAETMLLLNMAAILARFDINLATDDSEHSPEVEFTTGITSHIKPFPVVFVPRA